MGTTNQTVVNFSIKELTDKLKRIHMKTCIMYKHKDKISFPSITRCNKSTPSQYLPSDEEIITAVEKAHCSAREELQRVGLMDPNFTDAIIYKLDPPSELEFVNCCEGSCFNSETEPSKEPEFISVGHANAWAETDSNIPQEPICEAVELFPNCSDNLNLKSTTVGSKYSFKIRDLKGQIKTIKKATLLWMMAPSRFRLSNDRLRRFTQREFI